MSNFKRKRFIKMYHLKLAFVGYIDEYNIVHSKEYDATEEIPFHQDLFGIKSRRWRWDFSEGITAFGGNLETGDGDLIRDYLQKKYNMRWFENGYHDWEYIVKIAES